MGQGTTLKFTYPYSDTDPTYGLVPLSDLLFRYIEYEKVTVVMTQAQYNTFTTATDGVNISANRFRPIDLTTNTKKPEWAFDGKLQLFIKVKD